MSPESTRSNARVSLCKILLVSDACTSSNARCIIFAGSNKREKQMAQIERVERHCYKCDSHHSEEDGAFCRDGRGRVRFVCKSCLKYVHPEAIVGASAHVASAKTSQATGRKSSASSETLRIADGKRCSTG